jgi:hypothetical protein
MGGVVVDAGEDVFLAAVVVVERRAGDVEPFGDLAQGGSVPSAFAEDGQGDVVDALFGVGAAPSAILKSIAD